MKVLLVDDEQALLDVFSATLQTGGLQVVTAVTGTEGIDKAKTEKPDIILLDQVLPDINGNQVLQILKQDPMTQAIPVAMLSNFNQDSLVQDAINLGAIDYLLKYQVSPHDLIEKINRLLEETKTETNITKPTISTAPLPSTDIKNEQSFQPVMNIPFVPPPSTEEPTENPLVENQQTN